MAVERLTDYTRRIWTALDADAPEGHDFEVGDVIYYMDSSRCGIVTYVYPEGSIDVEFLPDIGGGGEPRSNYHVLLKNGKANDNINQIQVAQYIDNIDGIAGYSTNRDAGAQRYVYILNDNRSISMRSNVRIYGATYNDEPLTISHYYASSYHYTRIEMPANYDETIPIIIT